MLIKTKRDGAKQTADFKEITSLQYLGSKSRLLTYICQPIIKNPEISTVVDLFAGTGSVSYALKDYLTIKSNDLEYYAYILNQGLLNGCNITENELASFWQTVDDYYNQIQSFLTYAIAKENLLLSNHKQHEWAIYREFCETTPSVFQPITNDEQLKCLETLVAKIHPGSEKQNVDFPCLFVTYFANAYFGIKQCCEIDAICAAIQKLTDVRQKYVLLSALMSVMSITASTTTHFAQYLTVKNVSTYQNIVEKRRRGIIDHLRQQLQLFRENGLLKKETPTAECFNLNYEECLNSIPLDQHTLVYADPPYFKEHYSRYYHVLNTLCLYDYPQLAINPQTKGYSIGRYRTERKVSDFGKKSLALRAFEKLIDICASRGAWLMISYSDTSIAEVHQIEQLARKRYSVIMKKIELNHSNQGRTSRSKSKVDEYVFICQPQMLEKDVDTRLSRIRAIKPIVDNPAGLMHNYMARKPYNIIAELISSFCPAGGTVYDPMFGSGTTIIEASKVYRQAIGADINPVAYALCHTSLKKWDLERIFFVIDRFVEQVYQKCAPIYSFYLEEEERIIERCHFDRCNGALIPTKYWYKKKTGYNLSARKSSNASAEFIRKYNEYSSQIVKYLKDIRLIPNSRIAIGKKDSVFTYFCKRNLLALDLILETLANYRNEYGYEVLELIVSSAINLIKLSDKKASSQMPYWLPKTNVTSRNAIMIIQQKAAAFKDGLIYLHDSCHIPLKEDRVDGEPYVALKNIPAQFISKEDLPDNSVDLILTDPPYTDQIPYLEYSQLWNHILGLDGSMVKELEAELVVSDAQSRKKDLSDFNQIFEAILKRSSLCLKDGGYFILFYHTFDLTSWSQILTQMKHVDLVYRHQMAVAAPRKSFKAIMSPNATLDGNYVIVFQKEYNPKHPVFQGTLEDAKFRCIQCAKKIIAEKNNVTTQELYDCGMLRDAFEGGYLELLAKHYSSFTDVILQEFKVVNGFWKVKECTGY